jgi:hypothetical protein
LFVKHDPLTSITALDVKFSLAMSSNPSLCRFFSFNRIEYSSASSVSTPSSSNGAGLALRVIRAARFRRVFPDVVDDEDVHRAFVSVVRGATAYILR